MGAIDMSTNWDLLIESHFAKKEENMLTLDMLMESIDEVMRETIPPRPRQAPVSVIREEDSNTLTWSSIPDIPISEIGWSAMETRNGVQIPSPERAQLEQFLGKIAEGQDLAVKLRDLSNFYKMDESIIEGLKSGNLKENIGKAISYLVFFKTLTQILTHFNAASAGFSFESFLAVLLGGKQIATNSQTIADLVDSKNIPISLKLYKEKQLEIGGSFTDLVLDLVKDNWNNTMQYIAVTKEFNEDTEGMQTTGTLNWYRFNFNIDNVFNIIARSSKGRSGLGSRKNILLPKPFMDANGLDIEGLPEKEPSMPHDEELETQFLELLDAEIRSSPETGFMVDGSSTFTAEELRQVLNWAKDDRLFTGKKERGKSLMVAARTLRARFQAADHKFAPYAAELAIMVRVANAKLVDRYKKAEQKKVRQVVINQVYFYDGVTDEERLEISRKFYEEADFELKKKCLMVCHGYITTGHFNLTQGMLLNIAQIAGPTPGELFPAGQNDVKIGSLEIGASNVMSVLSKIAAVLNENIFEIFNNLKVLTTNIQGYFAGGLEETEKAKTAITAAENIETKTAEVAGVTTGGSKELVPGAGGTRPQPGGRLGEQKETT
jgi:hypothetical protein